MRIASIVLSFVLITACGNDNAGAENPESQAGETPAANQAKREKKDRGDFTMLLDGVEWAATSASARLRNGSLKISASRMDGSPSTTMVRQSVDMDIANFDGPGTYKLGMSSMFAVVGIDTSAAEQTDLNQQLAQVLSKASMVRLQYSEVTIDSVGNEEITGRFSPGEVRSMGGETLSITDGRFRAIVKQ